MQAKISTLATTIQEYGQTMGAMASQVVVFGVLPTVICQWTVVSRALLKLEYVMRLKLVAK